MLRVFELRGIRGGNVRATQNIKQVAKALSGFSYEGVVQTLESITGVIQKYRRKIFICPVCILVGMSRKDATRPVEEGFVPKRRTRVEGLICEHCHDSGF